MVSLPNNSRGFTLLELLLSILIIGVLLALIVQFSGKTSQRGVDAKCMQNLRTIAIGINQYVADRGHYPSLRDSWQPSLYWYDTVDKYITGAEREATMLPFESWMICPGRRNEPEEAQIGYAFNYNYFGDLPPESGRWGQDAYMQAGWHMRPSRVRSPSQKILIADTSDPEMSMGRSEYWKLKYLYGTINSQRHARRHSGGGHYLFLDGHIEWMTPEEFWRRLAIQSRVILDPKRE